jgi:hypothetical protein
MGPIWRAACTNAPQKYLHRPGSSGFHALTSQGQPPMTVRKGVRPSLGGLKRQVPRWQPNASPGSPLSPTSVSLTPAPFVELGLDTVR